MGKLPAMQYKEVFDEARGEMNKSQVGFDLQSFISGTFPPM